MPYLSDPSFIGVQWCRGQHSVMETGQFRNRFEGFLVEESQSW